jgi:hypothetical protein
MITQVKLTLLEIDCSIEISEPMKSITRLVGDTIAASSSQEGENCKHHLTPFTYSIQASSELVCQIDKIK